MRILALALVSLLIFIAPSSAQSDNEAESLVREMLAITGEVDVMMTGIEDLMPLIEGNIRAAYPDLSSRQYIEIMDVYREEFGNSRDEFEDALVEVYATEFSAAELRELLEFYRTPIGQRFTGALPRIQQRAGEAGAAVGGRVDLRAGPRVQAIILGNE